MTTFAAWVDALESRHMADLRFAEVSRALRALSSSYVERRARLGEGAALSGAGKRAAFALFYGPLHFLLIRHVAATLTASALPPTLVDLGCGTGAAGAGWAAAQGRAPHIVGIDRSRWAVDEAAWTYRWFGYRGAAHQGDLTRTGWPKSPAVLLAAFTINELADAPRAGLLARLLDRAADGDRVLVVEPLAGFVAPWWKRWRAAFEARGGRADQWRLRSDLPPIVAKLDRAAGLHHQEITGRSLWL